MRIYGYVTDSENRGIELANVTIAETTTGTTTNKNGYYELLFADRDTVELVFSMIGYTTIRQRIIDPQEVMNINVEMPTDEQWIEEVEVRGLKRQDGTMGSIEAQTTRVMPDATAAHSPPYTGLQNSIPPADRYVSATDGAPPTRSHTPGSRQNCRRARCTATIVRCFGSHPQT